MMPVRRRIKRRAVAERFWSWVDTNHDENECWPWIGYTMPKGYGQFTLEYKRQLAHRVAWFLTYGRWPTPFCCHHCDNPPCCNPRHLFEGDNDDNVEDMLRKGRGRQGHCYGTAHPQAKLTDSDVRTIRRLYAAGTMTRKQLQKK